MTSHLTNGYCQFMWQPNYVNIASLPTSQSLNDGYCEYSIIYTCERPFVYAQQPLFLARDRTIGCKEQCISALSLQHFYCKYLHWVRFTLATESLSFKWKHMQIMEMKTNENRWRSCQQFRWFNACFFHLYHVSKCNFQWFFTRILVWFQVTIESSARSGLSFYLLVLVWNCFKVSWRNTFLNVGTWTSHLEKNHFRSMRNEEKLAIDCVHLKDLIANGQLVQIN